MKTLILSIIAIFLVTSSFSQEPGNTKDSSNFKIKQNALVWQKIYPTDHDTDALVKQLKTSGKLKNIERLDSATIIAAIENLPVDYTGAGYTRGNTPMYLISDRITANVTINLKPGRIRITIKNILLTNAIDTPVSEIGESELLETYALKKKNSEFKDIFLKDAATILTYTFNKIFTLTQPSPEDDNW